MTQEKEQNTVTSSDNVNVTEQNQDNLQAQKSDKVCAQEEAKVTNSETAADEEIDYSIVKDQNESLIAENERLKKQNEEMALKNSTVKDWLKEDITTLANAEMARSGCNFSEAVEQVKKRHPNCFWNSSMLSFSCSTPGGSPPDIDHDSFVAGIKNTFLGGK